MYDLTADSAAAWVQVEERTHVNLLVAGLRKEVQALILEGVALSWESYKLDPYVQKFAEVIFVFQEKVRIGVVSCVTMC